MSQAIEAYRRLRGRIDQAAGRLVDMHCRHIACRPGCHDCCTNFTVSAVEYRAILDDLWDAGVKELHFDAEAPCVFLKEGLCALYRYRPLICRTHGLPVAFLNDEASPPEVNVSFCPKNFADAEPEELDFGPENTIGLDELNAELAELNVAFAEERPDMAAEPHARIPLAQLREDLSRRRAQG